MSDPDFVIEEHEMPLDEVKEALAHYERKYGMTSVEFYEEWPRGETDFMAESVDWSSLWEIFQLLTEKK